VTKPSGSGSSGSVPDTLQGIKRKSEGNHAQDENQEERCEALPRARLRQRQARPGVQAPHPHQKTTKNKRQLRGTEGVHSTNMASVKAMLPYA